MKTKHTIFYIDVDVIASKTVLYKKLFVANGLRACTVIFNVEVFEVSKEVFTNRGTVSPS